jgi:SAM-dependent methyltransferase
VIIYLGAKAIVMLRFFSRAFKKQKRGKQFPKAIWSSGLSKESEFWKQWLKLKSETYIGQDFDDYEWRINPNSDLSGQPHIIRRLELFAPAGTKVSILDVGTGPLTCIGKKWEGREVQITAVDILADRYNKLLSQAGIIPLVLTQYAEAEKLLQTFSPNQFDLVYCQNALDHVYDPMGAINQMLGVVKPDHAVVLLHRLNEGENAKYYGLHQWNLCREENEFIIWNRDAHISVNKALTDIADVYFDEFGDPTQLLVSLVKRI